MNGNLICIRFIKSETSGLSIYSSVYYLLYSVFTMCTGIEFSLWPEEICGSDCYDSGVLETAVWGCRRNKTLLWQSGAVDRVVWLDESLAVIMVLFHRGVGSHVWYLYCAGVCSCSWLYCSALSTFPLAQIRAQRWNRGSESLAGSDVWTSNSASMAI